MDVLTEYLNRLSSSEDKELAIAMNQIISDALPDAEIRISYGLLGYYQPKQVCFFGINKQHIGFYPTDKPIEHFKDEIKTYLSGKTTLKFPKDMDKVPTKLIQRIAVWNLEN
ncbi:iron chaperone [Companilactobacillus nuruki]|uniref:YdhG-like domain-containing protein n=1 Tax=Companilactobacillus nuruki TaxID=1993540 RepID=A0A2N7AXV9_9LACO|nr:DUF1801 domain-containing protein [Companilactobacillus nuruki]PMD73924.1 hypothetical protein CBP76_00840 [Companilactobacillus nuruki]